MELSEKEPVISERLEELIRLLEDSEFKQHSTNPVYYLT